MPEPCEDCGDAVQLLVHIRTDVSHGRDAVTLLTYLSDSGAELEVGVGMGRLLLPNTAPQHCASHCAPGHLALATVFI